MGDVSSDAARELSKLGAAKGGQARANALSPEQRQAIARQAVAARWAKVEKLKAEGGAPAPPVPPIAITGRVSALSDEQDRTSMGTSLFEPSRRSVLKKSMIADAAARAELAGRCARALTRSAQVLAGLQKPDGYWVGDLLADTTLESDYILLQLWLYPPDESGWNPPTLDRVKRAAQAILARQRPQGGYSIYPQGDADISASVKAYTALKLAGIDPENKDMLRLRRAILDMGGLQHANSYTKINLSLFGLYPRQYVPTIPPELVLLPGGVLYEMSSWTRAIVVPLSIVMSLGGTRPVPHGFNLDDLAAPGKSFRLPRRDRFSLIFQQIDRGLKLWERRGPETLRREAIRRAEKWLIDHTRYSDGLGAIYPSMMYLIMALECMGYPPDHPDRIKAIAQFDNLLTETETEFYFQPCFSPVWDTAYAMFALGEMGNPPEGPMRAAADWLLKKEIRHKGDWSVKRPDLEPSGWAFEFDNEHYPDIDDTAMVLLGLQHANSSDEAMQERVERRAINWLVNMQSKDGGWAAFDVDNDWQLLNAVPFADHNAMLDPTCPDITGRVLEALCRRGFTLADETVGRAVEYLLKSQERNGSWYGRWGVNYVYGTFLALRGLRAAQAPATDAMRHGAKWLISVQNPDGGWGESCDSYRDDTFVPAPSTPSQTAWALLGLMATGESHAIPVRRGLDYLLTTQREDGTWEEELATGTGFPNVFYLRYSLYRQYFPHLALAHARRSLGLSGETDTSGWLVAPRSAAPDKG
jgi:squalene-hopene/tetraprenyl-beta-curcumene cyclase